MMVFVSTFVSRKHVVRYAMHPLLRNLARLFGLRF